MGYGFHVNQRWINIGVAAVPGSVLKCQFPEFDIRGGVRQISTIRSRYIFSITSIFGIRVQKPVGYRLDAGKDGDVVGAAPLINFVVFRSEEHTSELQSL